MSRLRRHARLRPPELTALIASLLLCAGLCIASPIAGAFAEAAETLQEPLADATVCYLGPEGTYTQEATERFFRGEGEYVPQATVADAVGELVAGNCDYAVIPQENTIGGPVVDYIDVLLANPGLVVVGEVELPIRQALLAAPGTRVEDVSVVYSHAQGIAQGRQWLAEHLPDAELVVVSSTAEGARMASEAGDGTCAAIASTGAADVYGLAVLAEDIQLNDSNKTRFYVLAPDGVEGIPADRMVFSAAGVADGLATLLDSLHDLGATVVAVHDRPAKTVLGEYVFLIECEDADKATFDALAAPGFELHYYGAFPLG